MARHQFFDDDLNEQQALSREFLIATLRVCQGVAELVSFDEGQGPLWTEAGERSIKRFIAFDLPFSGTPVVHASLSLFDFHCESNQRLDLRVTAVDEHGFVVELKTWGDTRLARVNVAWMAVGTGVEAVRPVVPTRPGRPSPAYRKLDLPSPAPDRG